MITLKIMLNERPCEHKNIQILGTDDKILIAGRIQNLPSMYHGEKETIQYAKPINT